MTDIKLVKELLYRLEDLIELGCQMPLVAFSQLKIHIEKIRQTEKENSDRGLHVHVVEVDNFIKKHQEDFDDKDERAISRGFQRMKKKHPDRLDEYRKWNHTMETLKEFEKMFE